MSVPLPKPNFSVQWHITTNCNNNCKHCYMYDERTFLDERNNTLSDEDLLKVFYNLMEFEKKWDCNISGFAFSGGDPLLRENWYEFLSVVSEHGKDIRILGNPESLSEENISRLKKLKVRRFQMSLDGLEENHDKFRSPGSFQRTVKKISELEENGIAVQIMFTLYPENRSELFPLIKYLEENTPLTSFSFDIGTASGNAETLDRIIDKEEIKSILEKYSAKRRRLKLSGHKLELKEKSHFFNILKVKENSGNTAYCESIPVLDGCLAGWYSVGILSDGNVMACRRMPIISGKMPEQSFEEIFFGDEFLKKLRRKSFFEGCNECGFYQYCRGCPAFSLGEKGDPFKLNPICFKELVTDNYKLITNEFEPHLTTTLEEEYAYFKKGFRFSHKYLLEILKTKNDVRHLFLLLMDSEEEKRIFLEDKAGYIKNNNLSVIDYDLLTLQFYFRKLDYDCLLEREESAAIIKEFVNRLKIHHFKSL